MTELEVRLSADIKDLRSKLSQAEKSVKSFGSNIDKEATKAGKGFKSVGNASGQANTSLLEFNRVIQDAPFGIQGVGNNITQLAGNFGNLVRTTGGAGAALKAVGAAFLGPGGVIFAISAAVSLFTVYGDKLKITTGFTRELAKVTGGYVGSVQSEIAVLRQLVSVASNEQASKIARENALDRINDKYSSYLGNLDLESLKTDKVKNSIDQLTKSLIKQAQVRGIEEVLTRKTSETAETIAKLQLELAENTDKLTSSIQNAIKGGNFSSVIDPNATLEENVKNINNADRGIQQVLSRRSDLGGLAKDFTNISNSIKEVSEDAQKELKPLIDLLGRELLKDLELDVSDADIKTDGLLKKLKESTGKVKDGFVNLNDIFGITASAQKTLDGFKPDFSNFQVQFNKLGDIVGFALKNSVSKIKPQLSIIEQNLRDFNTNASAIINDGIAQTFAGIGQAIGESLVNGGNVLANVGASLLGSVGSILVQLGTMAIGVGVGIKAIQASLATLNPVAAIGAGVALVALGSAFSAGARSLSQSSGAGSIVGQGSASTSTNTFQGGGFSSGASGGRVVFEISGQKLIGVLNNTLNGNQRLGGSVTIG